MISPVTDLVFGPSRSTEQTYQKLKTYPMFGPLTTCFFSRTHAPFTIVLNEYERYDEYSETISTIIRVFLGANYTGPTSNTVSGKRSLANGKYMKLICGGKTYNMKSGNIGFQLHRKISLSIYN